MSEVIMIVGYPASGKGTLAARFKGYVHLNRDAAGGKVVDLVPNMQAALKSGKCVLLDNTFPTVDSRQPFIAAAKALKVPIRCVVMDTSIEDAQVNACARMMQRYGHLLTAQEMKASKDPNMFPIAVLFAYRKQYQPPTVSEGFDAIEKHHFQREWPADFTNKALILDFDGTLRETISGAKYCTDASDIRILPGRTELLKKYRKSGYVLLGVSNQSGVAKGELTAQKARELFDVTCQMLGVKIETRFCPHNPAPISCYCRKPIAGLGVEAIFNHKLNPAECIFVGDMTTDRTFAERCGFKFVLASEFFR